jgi:uncharacterized protein (DUF1800 family)
MLKARAMIAGLAISAAMPGATGAWAADPAARLALSERLSWGPRGDEPGLQSGDPAAALSVAINAPLPPTAAQAIAAMRISRQPMANLVMTMVERRRDINAMTDPDARAAAEKAWQGDMGDLYREVQTRDILRALYSPAQLGEQMTWFWANHFSVHAPKREIRAMLGEWDDTLRAHALGKFRDLLAATVTQPAMLQYLDNDQNAAGHINENYAREIMELHTMGVGSGYSQKDVQELARILTGVGVRLTPDSPHLPPDKVPMYLRNGLFEFNPQRHDFGDKVLLGQPIHGQGWFEVRRAIDILANQPATRTHISRKLALFLLGHDPSPALLGAMTAEWQASDGMIARVVAVVLRSDEFRASLGQEFKDPVHYVLSAVRYAYGGRVIRNADPIINWLKRMDEPLYGRETPDGWPLDAAAWTGPGQMETRFEIAKAIGNGSAGLFKGRDPDGPDEPAFPQLQNALWFAGVDHMIGAQTRGVLDRAASSTQWNMLLLASPEFMRR